MSLINSTLEEHGNFRNKPKSNISLFDLKIGQSGIIKNIYGSEKLTKRLLALGCVEGTKITLKRIAPLGDPLIINFKGFDLAIRKNDAKNIFLLN